MTSSTYTLGLHRDSILYQIHCDSLANFSNKHVMALTSYALNDPLCLRHGGQAFSYCPCSFSLALCLSFLSLYQPSCDAHAVRKMPFQKMLPTLLNISFS